MRFDLQKASLLKRASAFLLDAILLSIMSVMAAWFLSSVLGYDGYMATLTDAYARYGEAYGITEQMQASDPSSLTEDEIARLNAASDAIAADADAVHAYQMILNLQLLFVTFGLLFGFLLLEFIGPLIIGNGQTIGKKIFGIALMRVDGVKIGHLALFVRTILGKYAVGTMIPAYCLVSILNGSAHPVLLIVSVALLIAQAALLLFTKEHALLHDKMAATVAVDMASQMIFDSPEALIAYKERIHAESVSHTTI